MTFTCPATIGPREVNGQISYWIRVRIAAGNYGVEARYEPVIEDPETGVGTGCPMAWLYPPSPEAPS